MNYSFLNFLQLLGGLGLFIYGMKTMSDALQKASGARMRHFMERMTANRFRGITTGVLSTFLLQSSSTTTVMTVSFVSAGILTLTQSIGVVMGANIGTTLTAWLVSFFGLGEYSITPLLLPLIALGTILLFIRDFKYRVWGELSIGFALLFLGLQFMREFVPDLSNSELFLNWIQVLQIEGEGYLRSLFTIVLFIVLGVIAAILLQSSSAAIALTLVLVSEGIIPYPVAAAIVIGENIGTTITANIAAWVGNVQAKRAAIIHTLFNLFGVVWIILLFKPVLVGVDSIIIPFTGESAFKSINSMLLAIPVFHSFFNITNTLIWVGFTEILEKMAYKIYPAKKNEEKENQLEYFSGWMINSSEFSIFEGKKALFKLAEIGRKSFLYIPLLLTEIEDENFEDSLQKVLYYENTADQIEKTIKNFIHKLSENDLSAASKNEIREIASITAYIERTTDLSLRIARSLDQKRKAKVYFTPEQRSRILKLSTKVTDAFDLMIENIHCEKDRVKFEEAKALENSINKNYQEHRTQYMEGNEKKKWSVRSGVFYMDILNDLERIADHLCSISEVRAGNKL